jgi:hypothetical protein
MISDAAKMNGMVGKHLIRPEKRKEYRGPPTPQILG